MKKLLTLLLFMLTNVEGQDPEAHMTVEEVVEYHGYPIETYDVITDDGYILPLHRIPYGKKNTTSGGRKVVIIQHGVFCNSGFWVADVSTKNLPYLLADRGYDVFLPNYRGNNLGRRHKTLSPDEEAFWDFSFNENAIYDQPAIFNRVLEISGAEKFTYIGHSMSTTTMFIFLSKNPDYDKVTSFHAMSPIAFVRYSPSPLMQLGTMGLYYFYWMFKLFGVYELFPNSTATNILAETFCAWHSTAPFCSNSLFLIFGYDNEQFNDTRLPVYLHFVPVGTSVKTMYHHTQMTKAGKFQEFDYGSSENLKRYNQSTPPLYNVSKIKTDVYMYTGLNDWIASPKDVEWLVGHLKTLKEHYVVNYPKFNHLDFGWALEVIPFLYEKLIQNIDMTSS